MIEVMMASIELYLHDTKTRARRAFVPLDPEHVTLYVCGPTVYDHAHIGNARAMMVFDVLVRLLRLLYPRVTYARNITDIDDKINARAQSKGVPIGAVTARTTAWFHRDMAALYARPPDIEPRATETIPDIIAIIERLIGLGHAYAAEGHVLFAVATDPDYGKFSGRSPDELLAGARIDVAAYKRDPGDFVLWKPSAADLPGWDSPWGRGRPGWHIECSAMIYKHLGETIDIHGGGTDLLFPHHENERAQSQAHYGCEPAQFWVHNGLITQNDVKMSKSLGNGLGLADLLQRLDPIVLRTYLLSVHYRTPLDFRMEAAEEWGRGLTRIWRLWEEVSEEPAPAEWIAEPWARSLEGFEARLLSCLDDDFNTAKAFAEVFEMVHAVNQGVERQHNAMARGWARKNLQAADAILGLLPQTRPAGEINAVTQHLLDLREAARGRHDFHEADLIRELFAKAGYTIEDTPEGPRILSGPKLSQT
jgi:cysteinyl-tRNA synthetase